MKATINNIVLEGTPEEIVKYQELTMKVKIIKVDDEFKKKIGDTFPNPFETHGIEKGTYPSATDIYNKTNGITVKDDGTHRINNQCVKVLL